MTFKPGDPRPPGAGMKKGTKIISTKMKETARETFIRMMNKAPIEYALELFNGLENDKDKLKALTELMNYVEPKLAQTQVTANVNVTQSVDELLAEFNKLDESKTD